MIYGNLAKETAAKNEAHEDITYYDMLCAIGEASLVLESDQEFVFTEETLLEGTNIETLKAFREGKKKLKPHLKALKKALKSANKEEAKSEVKQCDTIINDMKKAIKEIPDQTSSAVLGLFFNGIVDLFKASLVTFGLGASYTGAGVAVGGSLAGSLNAIKAGYNIANAGSIVSWIGTIISNIKAIIKIANTVKEKNGPVKVKDLNMWKAKLLSFVDDYQKKLDKLANAV